MSLSRTITPLSFLFSVVIISACSGINITTTPTLVPTETITFTPVVPTPTLPTSTPFTSPTSSVTPTQEWVFQSGAITCPILLYHRISEPPITSSLAARYYTSPLDFKWQMQSLKDWGYTTIPISLLVDAVLKGAVLPPRPLVISFDDGDISVSQNAFPIMQEMGFTGVIYLVGNYIGTQGYMDVEQIQILNHNGWEIGSHSMSHPHLPEVHEQVYYEAGESRTLLINEIGARVDTFAYPFGEFDLLVKTKIVEYGYTAAVGLGTQYIQGLNTLYYMSRIEIQNGVDLAVFASLLPWSNRP
jgi:peptidoglycan/xylan/chitin deacetylase (PgdA/CDA1 family)